MRINGLGFGLKGLLLKKIIIYILLISIVFIEILNNSGIFLMTGKLLHWNNSIINIWYYFFVIGVYLCVIVLLLTEAEILTHNIDQDTIILLIIFGIFRTNIGAKSEILFRLILFSLSGLLFVVFVRNIRKIPPIITIGSLFVVPC